MVRIVADEGKVLTNGSGYCLCVDTAADRQNEWTEVDEPAGLYKRRPVYNAYGAVVRTIIRNDDGTVSTVEAKE